MAQHKLLAAASYDSFGPTILFLSMTLTSVAAPSMAYASGTGSGGITVSYYSGSGAQAYQGSGDEAYYNPEKPASDGSDGTIEVPADGALLLEVTCTEGCDKKVDLEQLELQVSDEEGAPLHGKVVDGAFNGEKGWLAWKPNDEFSAGSKYAIARAPTIDDDLSKATILALPSTGEQVPSGEVQTRGKVVDIQWTGKSYCCQKSDSTSDGVESQCSHIATDATEEVQVYLYLWSDAALSRQFAFFARASNGSSDEVAWDPRTEWVLTYPKQEEYCYEVLARHLASGEETLIGSGCEDNERVDFPHLPTAIATHNAGAFEHCVVPPEGQKQLWCETFAEAVDTGSCQGYPDQACEAALEACPPFDSASPGGTVGAGGAGPEDDAAGLRGDLLEASAAGCSIGGGFGKEDGVSKFGVWSLVLAAGLAFARRLRKARA